MQKLLHYTQLAAAIKRPPSTVYRWLFKRHAVPLSAVSALEKATGYSAEAWAFPVKYKNPYFTYTNKAMDSSSFSGIEQATGGQVTRDELLFPELYQENAINSKQDMP